MRLWFGVFLARSIPASDSPGCTGTGALRPCALMRSERGTEELEELLKRWQLGWRRFPHHFKACVCVCSFSNVFLNSVLCCCRSIQPCSSQVDYSWNPPTLSGCLGNSLNCCLLGHFFRLLKVCLLWELGGGGWVEKKKTWLKPSPAAAWQQGRLAACSSGTRQRRCCWGGWSKLRDKWRVNNAWISGGSV